MKPSFHFTKRISLKFRKTCLYRITNRCKWEKVWLNSEAHLVHRFISQSNKNLKERHRNKKERKYSLILEWILQNRIKFNRLLKESIVSNLTMMKLQRSLMKCRKFWWNCKRRENKRNKINKLEVKLSRWYREISKCQYLPLEESEWIRLVRWDL
jgi:hypothetical protein